MVEKEVIRIRSFVYVIGLIGVAIMVLFETFLNGYTSALLNGLGPAASGHLGAYSFGLITYFWPFLILLLVSLLAPLRLSKQELTVLVTMFWVTWMIPTYWGCYDHLIWPASALAKGGNWRKWIIMDVGGKPGYADPVWWWCPDITNEDIWNGFLYGGVPTPWAEWAPALAFYSIFAIAYYLTFYFWAAFFRRTWIDIESVPFPMATGAARLIEMASTGSSSSTKVTGVPMFLKNKYLWTGFGLMFLLEFQYWLPYFTPLLPKKPATPITWFDLTPIVTAGPLPWSSVCFALDPTYVPFLYLLAPSLLLSYVIFAIILWWLWPPITSHLGLIDPPSQVGGWGGVWTGYSRTSTGPVMDANWALFSGGMYTTVLQGAVLCLIWWPMLTVHRPYIARAIKSLWKPIPKEEEAKEPMPYRKLLVLIIVFWIFWAFMIYVGSAFEAPFWYGLLAPAILIFGPFGLGMARMSGDFGEASWGVNPNWQISLNAFGWWFFHEPTSPAYKGPPGGYPALDPFDDVCIKRMRAAFPVRHLLGFNYMKDIYAAPLMTGLESFKIGALTNTPSRYQFIGGVMAIVLAIVLSHVFQLNWFYMFGARARFIGGNITGWPHFGDNNNLLQSAHGTLPYYEQWSRGTPPTMYVAWAIGFIITAILFILRARFTWFTLHPAGFAFQQWIPSAMIVPAIIAYILKRLTIRVGGTRLYAEKGLPFAIGMIAAVAVVMILTGIFEACLGAVEYVTWL